MPEFRNLQLQVLEGVATLTIHRPDKLNALDADTIGELGDAVRWMAADAAVRGVIVTGSGSKAFVAGADYAVSPVNFAGSADVVGDFNADLAGLAGGDAKKMLASFQENLQAALDEAKG